MELRRPAIHTETMEALHPLAPALPRFRRVGIVRRITQDRMLSLGTIAGLGAALALVGLGLGHYTTFFSADAGVKFLAAQSIVRHWTDPSIPYPFATADPAGRYVLPLTDWISGRDYAGYSLIFEYMTAGFVALFGAAGTVFPPIAGTICLLFAQLQLANLAGVRNRRPLLVATVVATPVVFYSLTLWEHTWGVALFLGAAAVLLGGGQRSKVEGQTSKPRSTWATRSRTLAVGHSMFELRWQPSAAGKGICAGAMLAGAIFMRREMVIPAAVLLAMSALIGLRTRRLLVPVLAGLVPIVSVGAVMRLQPEPLAVSLTHASSGRAGVTTVVGTASHLQRIEWLTAGGFATVVLLAFTVLLILTRWRWPRALPPLFAAGSVAAGLALVIQLVTHFSWSNDNPLAFSPILIWGLWSIVLFTGGARDRGTLPANDLDSTFRLPAVGAQLLLWLLSVLGCVAIMWFAYDYGGGQWGPRYLLFVFPLLLILAFRARELILDRVGPGPQRHLIAYAFVFLLVVSALEQGIGLGAIVTGKREWSRTASVVEALPARVVVSTGDPSLDSLASIYGSKTMLWASTPSELTGLMNELRNQGVRSVALVCGPRSACPWDDFAGWRRDRIRRSNFVRYASYQERGRSSAFKVQRSKFNDQGEGRRLPVRVWSSAAGVGPTRGDFGDRPRVKVQSST